MNAPSEQLFVEIGEGCVWQLIRWPGTAIDNEIMETHGTLRVPIRVLDETLTS